MDALLQSFDTLWFFHDVLARTNQIDPPYSEFQIKDEERSPDLTDQVIQNQNKSPEIDLKLNSGDIEIEIEDKIKSEIVVQPPQLGEIEPEIVQKPESGEIEPDVGQQQLPVFEMEFKTTAAMLENSTEKRKVRRKSRRKNSPDLLRRPAALFTPYLSGYSYGYGSGGNQWHRTIEIPSLVPEIASTAVK